MSQYNQTSLTQQVSMNDYEKYHIREMKITDLASVIPIDKATWGDSSWSMDCFIDIITDRFHICWTLECLKSDHSIVGYGFQRLTNGICHITNLCVHPDHRSRGLGEILLVHMINHARSLNILRIVLEVSTCNIPAYKLYVKHGFIITHILEQYYSERDDAYRMELFLN